MRVSPARGAFSRSPDPRDGAQWRYAAIDRRGRERSGVLAAPDRASALALLAEKGLAAHELARETAALQSADGESAPPFQWRLWDRASTAPLDRAGATLLVEELARLVAHGAPLERALAIAVEQTPNHSARAAASRLRRALSRGVRFADAIAQERAGGGALPAHAIGVIAAGEASGALGAALARLADDLTRDAALRRSLRGALAYPIVLAIAGVTVALILLLGVAPQFERAFSGVPAADRPSEAMALIAVSDALRGAGPLIAWSIGAVILAALIAGRRAGVRQRLNLASAWALRRLPGVSGVLAHRDAARWCAAMGALLSGGATLTTALATAVSATTDPLRRAGLERAGAAVSQGRPLSTALREAPHWPALVAHYARLGEETGRLGEMMTAAARLLETDADHRARSLAAAAGPILVLLVGALIGAFVATMFAAVLSLNELAL